MFTHHAQNASTAYDLVNWYKLLIYLYINPLWKIKECISRNSQHIWTEIKGAVGGRLILWHYKNNRKWQTLHSQIARLTMSRLTNTKTINNNVMLQVVSFQDSRPQQSFGMHTHPNWSSNITSTFHFQHVHHTSIFPEKRKGY